MLMAWILKVRDFRDGFSSARYAVVLNYTVRKPGGHIVKVNLDRRDEFRRGVEEISILGTKFVGDHNGIGSAEGEGAVELESGCGADEGVNNGI